jgi:hypothetical protein
MVCKIGAIRQRVTFATARGVTAAARSGSKLPDLTIIGKNGMLYR